MGTEDAPESGHPTVQQPEEASVVQERERALEIASVSAQQYWRKIAKAKDWDQVKAHLDVYRHAGGGTLEKIPAWPRSTRLRC